MLTVDQAITILARFQAAAPPGAAEKLGEVSELLRHLDSQMSRLNMQLQDAEAIAEASAQQLEEHLSGSASENRTRSNGGERTVTDQLAEIFDVISTRETEALPLNGASGFLNGAYGEPSLLSLDIAPDATDLPVPTDPSDPLTWLKEAMPQLFISDAPQEGIEAQVRQASARKETAPILDMLTPLQEALRPAIMMVRAQSERLQSGKMGRLTTEQSSSLRAIRDQADSALSLVDTVGQVLSVHQGRLRVDLSKFDAVSLVQQAIGMMQPSARARDNQLLFTKPQKMMLAFGDHEIALMIMIDLLDNAIRYSPVGSVTRISIDELGSHLLINVADSGIGLSESDFMNVGKPFWRAAHQSIVRDNPGSGLRLYLAQRLLALQNGELIFSGEVGMGSTFSFTLPAVGDV